MNILKIDLGKLAPSQLATLYEMLMQAHCNKEIKELLEYVDSKLAAADQQRFMDMTRYL